MAAAAQGACARGRASARGPTPPALSLLGPPHRAQHLAKLLWFYAQGQSAFGGLEAQAVFFGVTKLFQSTDGNLRRMVYLFLRAAADSTDPSNLIIVTQSLVKDMFNETNLYKGNALRCVRAGRHAPRRGDPRRRRAPPPPPSSGVPLPPPAACWAPSWTRPCSASWSATSSR